MTARRILYLFPGQGSQYVGIGADLHQALASVRDVYQRASDALGYDIARVSFHDPDGVIDLTRHTQPVLLTHSIACWQALRELTGDSVVPAAAAGHSLGEYSALVAAGAIEFDQALKLVKARGELMGEFGEGAMEALPLNADTARPLADKYYCAIAACNLPEQTVVGGRSVDLDRLVTEVAERFPRKRTARLKTEGAFHTYYMISAAQRFRAVLDQATIQPPAIDVLSNYSGDAHAADADSIKSHLFLQLFHPVLWHRNLLRARAAGIDTVIEFGGGIGTGATPADKRANLEGIVKKTFRGGDPAPTYHPVINLATLQAGAEQFA